MTPNDDADPAPESDADMRFHRTVADKQARKESARREDRSFLFWVGMYGLVGWSVAVPTLLGIALGLWLDQRAPAAFSWTISLLLVGLVVGCLSAWYWVRRESRRENHGENRREDRGKDRQETRR